LLLILIGSLIGYSNLEEYIPLRDYTYEISPSDVQYIKNLEIYHNFSDGEGLIIFEMEKESFLNNRTKGFQIGLPAEAKKIRIIQEINETQIDFNDWQSKLNTGTNQNFTWIILGENYSINYTAKYLIYYNSELIPNSIIRLNHWNVKTYGYSPKIYLNLGNDYLCLSECIEPKQNIEIGYMGTEKDIILEPRLNNYEENTDYSHSARLHVIRDIRGWQAFLIGLIVSSLFSIIILCKELLEEFHNKKSEKPIKFGH
jgi:hypothetical protein